MDQFVEDLILELISIYLLKKKKASIEVLKYLISDTVQKEIIIKKLHLASALNKLYDDEEVCSITNCNLMKEIQPMIRPSNSIKYYDKFSSNVVTYLYEFLSKKKTANEILNNINDILKIYYLSIKTKGGVITLIILIFILLLILLSLVLLFIPNFKKYFKFLSKDLWIIYSLGSIMMTIGLFSFFGKQNDINCNIYSNTHVIGNFFYFIPILYKLLINFPKINKYSNWIKKNKVIFLTFCFLIHFITSIINILLKTFKSEDIILYMINNKNFTICFINNYFGYILYMIQILYNIFIHLCIFLLIFFEWNMEETYYDLRTFTILMIINGISEVLCIIVFNLTINNYIIYMLLYMGINLIFILSNHIFISFIRILFIKYSKNESDEHIINKLLEINNYKSSNGYSNSNSEYISSSKYNSENNSISKSSSKHQSVLLSYHYSTKAIM